MSGNSDTAVTEGGGGGHPLVKAKPQNGLSSEEEEEIMKEVVSFNLIYNNHVCSFVTLPNLISTLHHEIAL